MVKSWNSSDMKYLALSLIILSGAPTSQKIDFNASITSMECRLHNSLSKMQQVK